MNKTIVRLTTGITLALATLSVVQPAAAHATPAAAVSASSQEMGDAPLPSYPGLPATRSAATVTVSTTPTPCASNGADKNMTRAQALTRAQSWLSVGIPYSQSRCYRNEYGDYRTDCSGFVSMAWGVGGLGSDHWTGNFLDISHVIARADLQPGDALLRHEGNPDVDHVALFVRWEDSAHTKPVVIEQTGSRNTVQDTWSESNASHYKPVRYNHIVEGGSSANGVAAGDVTGDGRSDLVARKSDGTLWLYANGTSNTAPYSGGTQIGTGWQGFAWFLVGDVTGDHRADIVAAKSDGTLWLYTNGTSNTAPYNSGIQIGSAWQQFRNITLADVTGDGRADLVAALPDGSLFLYANGTSNTAPYSAGVQIGTGWQAFNWVLAGDVTGDHRADIVAEKADGSLWLYANGTSDTAPYGTGTQIGTGWGSFDRIQAGDVTGDGRADMTASKPDGSLWLYANGTSNTTPYSGGTQIGTGWQAFA